eukprot:CAMPEP_0178913826 /NCGR_PEP_ID=MMETSP0786-20121207/11062_1 /TAXON_ID=186022 /ORGANISM="Thalassionema frauenfeldii, Strain CCMP 1798" /LENGTH=548 /DNA_ID=CAMNT_0020586619 /DNA_START=45 /DNA_END=1691 /DNA_ORIENTATION=+
MSLDSLIHTANQNQLKFVFVGGKGGVGKTTSSCAIASLLATICQKKVLLVSTDPAHSLGDAWRTSCFSHVPASPMPNLDVVELDPKETMESELQTWVELAKEFEGSEDSKLVQQVSSFQEWLAGVPGIDEATALSSAIGYIDSGTYDMIVFDTAPTGHTLKLLALPEILEKGIEKLQSWQSTLWSYWEAFKGLAGGGGSRKLTMKEEISEKLTRYQRNIQKVATMLQDPERTRFVVVCIAEFLSVCETQRLLQELRHHRVRASHIVVNQLFVANDIPTREELLSNLEESMETMNNHPLRQKILNACRLTASRKEIQQKYLRALQNYPETKDIVICEMPLLPEEITGADAIRRFSGLLVSTEISNKLGAASNVAVVVPNNNEPLVGSRVKIMALEKSPHLNGMEGTIVSDVDDSGCYGVSIIDEEGKTNQLTLPPKNISIVHNDDDDDDDPETKPTLEEQSPHKKKRRLDHRPEEEASKTASSSTTTTMMSDTLAILQQDPEIKRMIDQNPRVQQAVEDVLVNPGNVMKYIADPEMSPFIMKAMAKLKK